MYSGRKKQYRFETFTRPCARSKDRVIYVRFLDDSGAVLATRSTGALAGQEGLANAEILRLTKTLDLEALAANRKIKKAEKQQAVLQEEPWREMSVAEFLAWFWSEDSEHVQDALAAKRSLSGNYLVNNRAYIRAYVSPYEPFCLTPLRKVSFALVEAYFRTLRTTPQTQHPEKMVSRSTMDYLKRAMRSAINWAAARGACKPVDFSGFLLPASTERERGLLTDDEISKLLTLPVVSLWRGEARTAGKHQRQFTWTMPENSIDIRMKAFVLLGPYCGFRRGEERGLKWQAVDLQAGEIRIENNVVRYDSDKGPKKGSLGTVPIAPELEIVLWELWEAAKSIGFDHPDDYILFNPSNPKRPASESVLRSGWIRALRAIGITDEARATRNLVPHGTRHRFATKLLEAGLSPREAQQMTRHKTLEMLERYADHISAETMAKAKEAVRGRIEKI